MIILAMDPSGSFTEGKGTTGYSVWAYNDLDYKLLRTGQIAAIDYETQQEYWNAHIDLIKSIMPNCLVLEDYLLYAHKASQQIGSKMETPKIIGIIEFECNKIGINIVTQRAVDVKKRWEDRILIYKNLIIKKGTHYTLPNGQKVSKHIRDSMRHGIHYIMKERNKKYAKRKKH